MLVSEIEKNAETKRRTTSAISSVESGISSKRGHHVACGYEISIGSENRSVKRAPASCGNANAAAKLRERTCCRYRQEKATGNLPASSAWPRGRATRKARVQPAGRRR